MSGGSTSTPSADHKKMDKDYRERQYWTEILNGTVKLNETVQDKTSALLDRISKAKDKTLFEKNVEDWIEHLTDEERETLTRELQHYIAKRLNGTVQDKISVLLNTISEAGDKALLENNVKDWIESLTEEERETLTSELQHYIAKRLNETVQDKTSALLDRISKAKDKALLEENVGDWIESLTEEERETLTRELQHYITNFVARGGSIKGLLSIMYGVNPHASQNDRQQQIKGLTSRATQQKEAREESKEKGSKDGKKEEDSSDEEKVPERLNLEGFLEDKVLLPSGGEDLSPWDFVKQTLEYLEQEKQEVQEAREKSVVAIALEQIEQDEYLQEAEEALLFWNPDLEEAEKEALRGDSVKMLLAFNVLEKVHGKFQGLGEELRVLSEYNPPSSVSPLEEVELRILFDRSLFPSMPLSEQLETLELLFAPEIIAEHGFNVDDVDRLTVVKKYLDSEDEEPEEDEKLEEKQLEYRTYMQLWNKVAYAKSQQKASEERSLSEDEKQLLEMRSKWLDADIEALKKKIEEAPESEQAWLAYLKIAVLLEKAITHDKEQGLNTEAEEKEQKLRETNQNIIEAFESKLDAIDNEEIGIEEKIQKKMLLLKEMQGFIRNSTTVAYYTASFAKEIREVESSIRLSTLLDEPTKKAMQKDLLELLQELLAHWQERLLRQEPHPSKEELCDLVKAIREDKSRIGLSSLNRPTKRAMQKALLELLQEPLAHWQERLLRQDPHTSKEEELYDFVKAIREASRSTRDGGLDIPDQQKMQRSFLGLLQEPLAQEQERLCSQDSPPSKEELYDFVKAIREVSNAIGSSTALDISDQKEMQCLLLGLLQAPLAQEQGRLCSQDAPTSKEELYDLVKAIREANETIGFCDLNVLDMSDKEEMQRPLLELLQAPLAQEQERLCGQDSPPSEEDLYDLVKAIQEASQDIRNCFLNLRAKKELHRPLLELLQEPLAQRQKYLFSDLDSPLPSKKERSAFSKAVEEANNSIEWSKLDDSTKKEMKKALSALKKNPFFKMSRKAIRRVMRHVSPSARRQRPTSEISHLEGLAITQGNITIMSGDATQTRRKRNKAAMRCF